MNPFQIQGNRYHTTASGITVLAHVFGLISLILLLVWLLHYREGLDLDSGNAHRVFNVHPFLMFFGFIFFAGEGAMAYKTVRAVREIQKFFHLILHLSAIVLGIVGIYAAFKFHDMVRLSHMYSLHSWIGMATFILFGLQWLFGFSYFMLPRRETSKARALPWHISGGRALLYMSICAAETGLMQKETQLRLQDSAEGRLVNFTALAILLFGITVDLSVTLVRYVF